MVDAGDVSAEWDRNAENWSESIAQGFDHINDLFGVPFFLDALGDIQNLDILDAGCGEGRSSRQLSARGARVTGVDVSAKMIAEAVSKESQEPSGIIYHTVSCTDLRNFSAGSFDLVTSYMAFMDMPQLNLVLRECYRVVRSGGRIAFLVRHPCFFTPGFSIYPGKIGEGGGLRVTHYFFEKPYQERWGFRGMADDSSDDSFVVTRFPYTLSDYVSMMTDAGFGITTLLEPRPSKEICSRLPKLSFWQRHAALYLFIAGIKP